MEPSIRKWIEKNNIEYNTEKLSPKNKYVLWFDLMGTGQLMAYSQKKTANALGRLHAAVIQSERHLQTGDQIFPMNDGVFVIVSNKQEAGYVCKEVMSFLGASFLWRPNNWERRLVRASIAYGPVINGENLQKGFALKKFQNDKRIKHSICFGPPVIQAYKTEGLAPPFGIFIHESARSFSPPRTEPFRTIFWRWWQGETEWASKAGLPPLKALAKELIRGLENYFLWMEKQNEILQIKLETVSHFSKICDQYFDFKRE